MKIPFILLAVSLILIPIFLYTFILPNFSSALTSNNFKVEIISERHSIVDHEVIFKIQNLENGKRKFNLGFLINSTNFDLSLVKDVYIYEYKPIEKEFPTYSTREVCYNITLTNQTPTNISNLSPISLGGNQTICYNETYQNGTTSKLVLTWKPSKMKLIKHSDKVTCEYGEINIPKFGSKCKYDDFGNEYDCSGTKIFKITWKTPIVRSLSGWGSKGYYAIYDALTNISYDPWWNTSWQYRRPITIQETKGLDRILEPVEINLTGLILLTNDCSKEVRITYGESEEVPFVVLDDSGQALGDGNEWCKILILANVSANSNSTYYVYYGNLNAVSPNYPIPSEFSYTNDPSNGVFMIENSKLKLYWDDTIGIREVYYKPYSTTTNWAIGNVYNYGTWDALCEQGFSNKLQDVSITTTCLYIELEGKAVCDTGDEYKVTYRLYKGSDYFNASYEALNTVSRCGPRWNFGYHPENFFDYAFAYYTSGSIQTTTFVYGDGNAIYSDVYSNFYSTGGYDDSKGAIFHIYYADQSPQQIVCGGDWNQGGDIGRTLYSSSMSPGQKIEAIYWFNSASGYDNNKQKLIDNTERIVNPLTYSIGTEETANQPPSVDTPKTYGENYTEQTSFSGGDKVVIRVNVTDPQGASDIDEVLIEIIDNSSVVQVSNESMVDLLSWYSGYLDWQYRKQINITEQSGNTLTDYQVAINITYDSDMQSDFDDLRFTYKKYKSPVKLTIDNTNNANTLTDYQIYFEFPKSIFQDISNDCRDLRFHPNASVTDWNSTTYPYWVEECGNTLKVWIKIDSIPASSTKDIYMYFGNSDATSLSNGYGVFELYDDFDDGTVNTTIWTVTGSVTESDGMIQITDLNSNYITTVNEFSENILIRGRAKTSWYAWGAPLVWGNDSWYVAEGSYFGALSDTQTNNNFTLYDGSRHYGTVAISLDTWYNIQHKIYNGNWSMWNCSDNFTLCDYADVSISYPYTSGKITLQGTQDGTAYWDYIYVAKYADPEPTVYISEQQDGDEEIEIPYWIEDKVDGSWAYVWVKVPEIPANNNATIYMYYGNPLATSESNNISVFDYFTDFDSDDGNWTLYNADASSGYYDGYFYLKGTGAGDAHYTYDATQYLNENVRIISSINETGNSGRQLVIDDGLNTQLYGTMIAVNGTHLILLNRDGGWSEINSTTYSYTDGIWIVLDFGCHYNGTGYVCKAQVRGDGTVLLGYDGLTGSGGYVGLRIGQAGEMWYDWFAIAKYADPEPTYSIGEEESNELANTYEYNYTLPTDAVRGTWTINVYANDTQNAWGYNTTTFGVIMDTTPPTITFVSQTPSNLNESSIEPVTIIVNITDESGINLSKVAFFTGVNHTLTQDFYHYNWSWRYPANDLQPDMRRADYRNMSYWFENVVFKESPDDIWTFAGYDNSTIQFNVIDNTSTYTTINVTFFSAQMLFPQIFPFDKMYLTAENKTGQYVELHKNNWMKIKFYPSSFYNYTTENYTIYIDLNVDPNFTPNTKPLEIYFCNSSYTTGDPLDSDYCVYVEDIDATDTRNITINQSSYIQNIFYISDGYIDGVKVTDEAYLVLRTTVPEAKAFRLYYADDEISQYINFTDFNHAWVSTDDGDTWNLVYYTPDFYLISTQAERDKIMYYVYACDNLDNCANSSMQYDSLDPVNHAPAEPLITAPTENENVTGLYNITWLTIGDPDFDTYNASVYLCNPDGSINTTLANNNITGDNTQYEYYYEVDFSAFPSGKYRINVTLCDIHGLCSSSLTAYNFSIYHIYNKTIEQPSGIYAVISRTGNLERVATLINTLTITLARIGNIIRELPKTISVTHLIKIRIGPYLPSLIVNIQAEIYKQIQIIREVIKDITTILQISRISNLAREVFQNVLVSIQAYKVIDVFREVSQNILISIQLFRVHINIIRDVLEGVILNIQISRIVSVSREVSQIIATTILGIRKVVAERLATVLPTISLIIYRQVTFYKTLIQNVISVPSLKVIRIPYISQIVTITEQISRQVYITRTIVVESIITIALKVISPVRHFFELISPPYTLFSWATEYENLVLIVITIMTITVLSTVYIWRHRKELFHRPEERY